MSTSTKQRICTKLGITENNLKGGNLFSPQSTYSKSINLDSKYSKGEKAIKYLSYANYDKKGSGSGLGTTPYQNYRIDILVPNIDPPKPLIGDSKINYKKSATFNNSHLPNSPLKSVTRDFTSTLNSSKRSNNANRSNLESISSNMKLSNIDVYSPVVRAKAKRDSEISSK